MQHCIPYGIWARFGNVMKSKLRYFAGMTAKLQDNHTNPFGSHIRFLILTRFPFVSNCTCLPRPMDTNTPSALVTKSHLAGRINLNEGYVPSKNLDSPSAGSNTLLALVVVS